MTTYKVHRASAKLKMKLTKVKTPTFKFKILPKAKLYENTVNLQGGGKVKVSVERGLGNYYSGSPNGTTGQSSNDDWTCRTKGFHVEKTDPDTVILNSQIGKIWPGAVYDFKTIASGDYVPLPYTRKKLVLVTDNIHNNIVRKEVLQPTMGRVWEAIKQMKPSQPGMGGRDYINEMELNSEESLFTNTSAGGYYLGFGGDTSLDFKSNSKTHKYYFEAYQAYYDIMVDEVDEPTDFFYTKAERPNDADAIAEPFIDPNWVYVDSVTYGRLLYIVVESSRSASEFGIEVNAWGNVLFAGGYASLDHRQKEYVSRSNITVLGIGGKKIHSGLIANATPESRKKAIDDYFKDPGGEVIISYNLRTLDQQAVGIRMITDFTEKKCAPRASRYKVTWTEIRCLVNDDGSNGEDIVAFARIRAKGNGKSILDREKHNKALHDWDALSDAAQSIKPAPWTFKAGNADNPIQLKSGEAYATDRYMTFDIPPSDAEAKIAIRVDVVEIDDFGNDQFLEKAWDRKISEISEREVVKLETVHEASRVQFTFVIEAIYNI